MIESTGHHPTESERNEAGIKHCRAEIKKWLGLLRLLQLQKNMKSGVKFVQCEENGRPIWFVKQNGKPVCRDYGYSTLGQAVCAATRMMNV